MTETLENTLKLSWPYYSHYLICISPSGYHKFPSHIIHANIALLKSFHGHGVRPRAISLAEDRVGSFHFWWILSKEGVVICGNYRGRYIVEVQITRDGHGVRPRAISLAEDRVGSFHFWWILSKEGVVICGNYRGRYIVEVQITRDWCITYPS